jgi:ribose 5-phosphate isomerase B
MTAPWRIAIGCDDAGYTHKQVIMADLAGNPMVADVTDVGVDATGHTDYPHVAVTACQLVASGKADRAILICGTGIGMAVTANKVPGIRAAVGHDSYSVERSVLSNNAQVLTLGQRVVGVETARRMVREWLAYHFDPSSASAAKVALISQYELARL